MSKPFEDHLNQFTKDQEQRNQDYLARIAQQDAELKAAVEIIPVLEGFDPRWEEEKDWFLDEPRVTRSFVLENKAAKIKFRFSPHGSGHTTFEVEGHGTRTFDRRGIEDSFYWKPLYEGHEIDLIETLNDQILRVAKSRERFHNAITIPGISFTVTPDGLKFIKEKLSKGDDHYFMPAGMGRGIHLSKKKHHQYFRRASKEFETFFDIAPLYMADIDAD